MSTATPSLSAQTRDKSLKTKNLRKKSLIPAEFYGHGMDNVSLQMDYQTFRRIYRTAGENTVIDLKIEGLGNKKVLVHQVDYHPVSDDFLHVEFINVRMDEEVTTHIPVHLEGQAPAVKELGGTLIQNLDEVEIRCLPGDLIHEVTLSVEPLVDFNAALHVSDIILPANIAMVTDPETTIASVTPPREEEPEAEIAEGAEAGEAAAEGEGSKEEGGEE